jgi:hypothetical protein
VNVGIKSALLDPRNLEGTDRSISSVRVSGKGLRDIPGHRASDRCAEADRRRVILLPAANALIEWFAAVPEKAQSIAKIPPICTRPAQTRRQLFSDLTSIEALSD